MCQIKTLVGEGKVHTIFFSKQWITIASLNGKVSFSLDARTFHEASINHLSACKKLKEQDEQRESISRELLSGAGSSMDDSGSVSDDNDSSNREGLDQNGDGERCEVLQTDQPSDADEETL